MILSTEGLGHPHSSPTTCHRGRLEYQKTLAASCGRSVAAAAPMAPSPPSSRLKRGRYVARTDPGPYLRVSRTSSLTQGAPVVFPRSCARGRRAQHHRARNLKYGPQEPRIM